MDDFTTYGGEFDEALENLEKTLIRCKESNISLNNEKCAMMLTDGIILGHHISAKGIQVDPTKIKVILNLSNSTFAKRGTSFLGYVGYYRRFIENFSQIAHPLFSLLNKNSEFLWTESCQHALEELKSKVFEAPILRGPNWSLPFHISTDASDTTIGVVLGQLEGNDPYTIYYINKNLSPIELNYMVTEKEFLVVIHAINKFWHYITGYPIILHTDHAAIKYLMNKPITNGRVTRWLLLLQEYDITILNKPGKDNVVA
jgi:hypothetical protein